MCSVEYKYVLDSISAHLKFNRFKSLQNKSWFIFLFYYSFFSHQSHIIYIILHAAMQARYIHGFLDVWLPRCMNLPYFTSEILYLKCLFWRFFGFALNLRVISLMKHSCVYFLQRKLTVSNVKKTNSLMRTSFKNWNFFVRWWDML